MVVVVVDFLFFIRRCSLSKKIVSRDEVEETKEDIGRLPSVDLSLRSHS